MAARVTTPAWPFQPQREQTQQVRLVVVHGIGSQTSGRTAQSWAEALVRFATAAGHRATVLSADLTGSPAEVEIAIHPAVDAPDDAPPTSRITVVEAYWADAFPEPTLGRVLRFLFTVAPTLAITQTRLILAEGGSSDRNRAAAVGRAGTTIAPIGLLLVALAVAAPVVAAVLLGLLVAASLPVSAVKKGVAQALGWLTTSIGDAYLFVADPVSRSAMVTRLESLLRPEAGVAQAAGARGTTVVLAHSQGAAVAYQALQRLPSWQRPAAFVTLGSGLGLLTDLDALRKPPWALTPLYVVIALAALVVLPLWNEPAVLGVPPSWLALGVGLVALAVVWWLCAGLTASAGPGPQPLQGTHWLDVWALLDPVPNGRAVTQTEGYQHQLVAGELSMLRDHVRYAQDHGQTLPLVLRRLLDPSGLADVPTHGVRGDRLWWGPIAGRDALGLLLRLVPLAAAVYAVGPLDLFSLGLWVRTTLPDWTQTSLDVVLAPVRTIGGFLEPWWPAAPAVWDVLGALTVAAVGLAGSMAVRRTLSSFQSWETRSWLATRPFAPAARQPEVDRSGRVSPDGRWGWRRWTAALAVVALVAAAVPALVWRVERGDGLWSRQQVVQAYVTALADDDLQAACAVTSPAVEGGDAGFPCGSGGRPSKRRICADAREALRTLGPDAFEVDGHLVTVDWGPEDPPSCDSEGSAPVLLPVQVGRAAEGPWRVTQVAQAS